MFTNYGEMAERSKAAVLKTVDVKASWGSNPYLSAKCKQSEPFGLSGCFLFVFTDLLVERLDIELYQGRHMFGLYFYFFCISNKFENKSRLCYNIL